MKSVIQLFLFVCCLSQITFAQSTKETVLFDYDKSFLTDNAKSKLDAVLSNMTISQLKLVELNGNTDADGDSKYNVALSKNRANEVLQYLVSKGIPTEKIQLKFDGENKPIAQNANEKGKQQNRRVDITFAFEEKEFTNTIFSQLEKESQYFTGKSNEIITITGKEGTKITIPKNALKKANGKYAVGKIDIELKEFYKKSDVIMANLHTMSDGTMLESGGMVYLKATSKGEELQLKKGTEITLEFASKNNLSDMQVFYGNPKADKSIDWNTNLIPIPNNSDAIESESVTYANFYTDGTVTKDTLVVAAQNFTGGKSFKRDYGEFQKLTLLDKTILRSAKLGWINCDRFSEVTEKTDILVDIDLKYKPEIRLVFKDINSIMSGYISQNNKLVLRNIPVGRKATLLAFSYVEKEIYLVMKEIEIDKNPTISLEMSKTSLEEFKTALQQLN